MRLRVTLLLAVLLLVGCARPAPAPAPPPPPEAPVVTPVQAEAPPTPPAAVAPPEPARRQPPAQVQTDDVKRVRLAAGQAINAPGYYYLNAATGQMDGWQVQRNFVYSDDRWLLTEQEDQAYLADRATGIIYGYDSRQYRFLAAGSGRLIFEELEMYNSTGAIVAFTDRMEPTGRFDVPGRAAAEAQLSPDGRTLAILRGWNPGARELPLYLVDLPSGVIETLPALPADPSQIYGALLAPWAQSGFGLFFYSDGVTEVYRYAWDGHLIHQLKVPGFTREVSRGGQFIAVWETVQSVVQTTVWYDVAAGEPLLRVMRPVYHEWGADDEQLYLADEEGGAWLVTRNGVLTRAPQGPKPEHYFDGGLGRLHPSPTDANLFAVGTAIIDGAGKVLQAARLSPGQGGWILRDTAWGSSGKEVRFRVNPPLGKGWDTLPNLPLPVRVQRPPLPEQFLLRVKAPAGDCLSLLERPEPRANVLKCLPGGTGLNAAVPAEGATLLRNAEHEWLRVSTEAGEVGYIAVSPASLDWAD